MKYMHMIHCWFSLNVELGAVGSIRTYARPPGSMVLTQYRITFTRLKIVEKLVNKIGEKN